MENNKKDVKKVVKGKVNVSVIVMPGTVLDMMDAFVAFKLNREMFE